MSTIWPDSSIFSAAPTQEEKKVIDMCFWSGTALKSLKEMIFEENLEITLAAQEWHYTTNQIVLLSHIHQWIKGVKCNWRTI